MIIINNNIINFTLEERDENFYNVDIFVNMIPHKGVYNPLVGFIYCSLPQDTEEDQKMLLEISNEIKKVLQKEI
jgi:hypothetical protein